MNRKVAALLLSLGASGLAIGHAMADDEKPMQPAPIAGKSTLGMTVQETQLVATGYRGSKILGTDVKNDKGEVIGRLDDVIVTPDGTLSVATIQVGGFLGMGGRLVAVPVRKLQLEGAGPKLILPGGTKEALKSMPEFRYSR
jgi:hypothetical protein